MNLSNCHVAASLRRPVGLRSVSHIAMSLVVAVALAGTGDVGRAWAETPDDFEAELTVVIQNNNGNNWFQNVDESYFDQVVLQSQSRQMFLDRVQSELEMRLTEIESVCPLTTDQKGALELASAGDLQRFLAKLEPLRQLFNTKRKGDPAAAQEFFNEFWQKAQPFQQQVQRGMFSQRSLFDRTLRATLNTEQVSQLAELEGKRREFRWKANVPGAIITLEQSHPMTHAQRQRLTVLLEENVPASIPTQTYQMQSVMLQVLGEKIGESDSAFPADGFAKLKTYLNNYRGMRFGGEMDGDEDGQFNE
jgi:hypothetical protein